MKFNEWTIKDHYPEMALQDIQPISLRAYSLLNRNNSALGPNEGAINLLGALEMLEALDYHFINFTQIEKGESPINQKHEAVAYLNRLGQLYFFTKSRFTKKYIPDSESHMPKVIEFISIRHKNTAHRSLDSPQKEPDEYRDRQAFTFLGATTRKFLGNEQYVFPNYNKDTNETEWFYFTPAIDHPIIMEQSYNLIEKIINELLNNL